MLVALKEIRLEHEEGAPCTAIREGACGMLKKDSESRVLWRKFCSFASKGSKAHKYCHSSRHHSYGSNTDAGL